jgi:hypothetical protein
LAEIAKTSAGQFSILGRSNNRPEMHTRKKTEMTCRCCAATVEAGAWRCHHCGEAHPTLGLRAVVLSPFAIALYIIATLAFITIWFWQDF